MSNNNLVAIVTGGTKGLGLGITNSLLNSGYKVVTCSRHKNNHLPDTNDLICLEGDVCDPLTHEKLVSEAVTQFGKLNVYINNAGISSWSPLKQVSSEFLEKLFTTNVYSAFWGCKAAQDYLVKNGSIINISSIAGKRGSKNNSVYVATKFAINGLTQSLAKELGQFGIRVNAICPVLIKTAGLMEALQSEYSPGYPDPNQFIDNFKLTQSALGRLPTSNEVADTVIYLASNKASAITGQCINVDCGVFPQ